MDSPAPQLLAAGKKDMQSDHWLTVEDALDGPPLSVAGDNFKELAGSLEISQTI